MSTEIGHELQKDFHAAKEAYECVLKDSPNNSKVLQQLGQLYHVNSALGNQEVAIAFLIRSIEAEPNDGQSWYLLGHCYMAQQTYRKAYDAYQQAVYHDSANPTYWYSIGKLYYQMNQYRDALDAYSHAVRLNPCLSEVWYELGTLYESCALDAYQRAAKFEPNNKQIQQRLAFLRAATAGGGAENVPIQQAASALVAPAAHSEATESAHVLPYPPQSSRPAVGNALKSQPTASIPASAKQHSGKDRVPPMKP